ncbi:radical SAM/SPASM domain-containing protein [uncultured Fibrobacter sp.]|uniref:radical SAM/SPASM domain-containing protein n=1 Tax=uncultured Fibrobacter sp. TaxID=261512 RepID=UPI002619AD02|nr:radical SAM/SPASM domain-containing protein [uncultured Fibrobacter sp.]
MNAIYIEITNACNLNCSFCPCGKTGFIRDFMNTPLFERCIAESASITENVYFHILGEPTLHPGFGLYLKKLEKTSLKLNLTTNGTTIIRTGKSILASPAVRQVNFSTHAYAELPQDQAQKHLQNVLDFCKLAKAIRPDLYINLRLWNVGDNSCDSWNQTFTERIQATFTTAAELSLNHFCSRHKSFLLEGRIYLHQDSRFEWPELDERRKNKDERNATGTCRALDTHVGILHDGRVVACCLDHSGQITLGKIQEQSLTEILESPLAKNIREGFKKHELRHPFCQNCSFCKRFGK